MRVFVCYGEGSRMFASRTLSSSTDGSVFDQLQQLSARCL